MFNPLLILLGKTIVIICKLLNLGNGSTWPGHVALYLNQHLIKDLLKANDQRLKTILVAGTNGKTTTGKLIQTILKADGKRVFQNESGANLLNGIASSLLLHSSILCNISYDYAVFEADEATLSLALKEVSPDYLILLNLFRDQLDRYGEVNTIAGKWGDAIRHLLSKTKLILNADDPQIASLGLQKQETKSLVLYYGLNDNALSQPSPQHAVDSTYCPKCDSKLFYNSTYYSHLGDWKCKKCKLKRPNLDLSSIEYYPVLGAYNRYNTLAAVLLAKQIGINQKNINSGLHDFTPAFGRQETLNINGKKVQIFLSKNPTSFNESLRTIAGLKAKNVLIVLNDRIPDGRDVSWIWDVYTEEYIKYFNSIVISGDRAFDMSLRIKYSSEFLISNFQFSMKASNLKFQIEPNLKNAISKALELISDKDTLFILPTYSAMLEVRKILTGKRIL